MALGEGDVDVRRYLQTLKDIGYKGPLTIERETPEDREGQKADIQKAVDILTSTKSSVLS